MLETNTYGQRVRRFGTAVLTSAGLAAGLAACSVTPAPPLPDTRSFFDANANVARLPATKTSCPEAEIPKFALQERIEGWVVGGLDIRADGSVKGARIHASSDPRFAHAAYACFMATQFYPAEQGGEAVPYSNHPMIMHFKIAKP